MSTALNLHASVDPSGKLTRLSELERCLSACQAGDLRERIRLARTFRPLIRSLAERRAGSNAEEVNRLCGLGREGLYKAASKYTLKVGAHHFRVFALDFIEREMDSKTRSFWQRLFGR
ncbi:MAG: hypothetical protein PHR35_21680 [Kiritimatiellae bacterium]|nr:hypothetical protein [Kiritimatiellia bacterium]